MLVLINTDAQFFCTRRQIVGQRTQYTCIPNPCQTTLRAERRIMVSSKYDTSTLPFSERITLLHRSTGFVLRPPIPAKYPCDEDEVPSSLPQRPSHGDNVVASSISAQHHPESNVDDEGDESYTEEDKEEESNEIACNFYSIKFSKFQTASRF